MENDKEVCAQMADDSPTHPAPQSEPLHRRRGNKRSLPHLSSSGTAHASASLHVTQPRQRPLGISCQLLPVGVHYILLYLLKCWKVTVKNVKLYFLKKGYN